MIERDRDRLHAAARHRRAAAVRAAITCCATVALVSAPRLVHAQSGSDASADASADGGAPTVGSGECRAGAIDCVSAPIEFRRRQGLPVELDWDTNWVPAGSPVQVRFRAAFVGHTEVRLGGALAASWHRAFDVETPPGPAASGLIETDYGIVLSARVRLHLEVTGRTFDWEGNIPYVPRVDFRATARSNIDPWSWSRSSVRGMTMRQHLADVALTDAIISIPGISGGLSFDAAASLETGYRSTRISFAPAPDSITESVSRIAMPFPGGELAEFRPRLEGVLDQRITVTVTPSLYVSLLGRRWMIPIVDVPVPIDTGSRPWLFDPQRVEFAMPDLAPLPSVIDFGDVVVGESATRSISADNRGGRRLLLDRSTDIDSTPFSWTMPRVEISPRGLRSLEMTFAPAREGGFDVRVPLLTSDPDAPTVYVTARGRGVLRSMPMDAGSLPDSGPDASDGFTVGSEPRGDGRVGPQVTMSGGCGCAVPTRSSTPRWPLTLSLLAAVAVLARRRGR